MHNNEEGEVKNLVKGGRGKGRSSGVNAMSGKGEGRRGGRGEGKKQKMGS